MTHARCSQLALFESVADGAVPQADFHMHTTWTDGADSARAMYDAAVAAGLREICFSEHARKTSTDWFGDFAAEIRALPTSPVKAWIGVEAKVDDFSGSIDSVPEILAECDVVMASVHRFPGETGTITGTRPMPAQEASEIEARLSLAVLDNPAVDVLGHPFGMTIRRFGGVPTDDQVDAVIKKCARTRVAFEINSRYHTDPWGLLNRCLAAGAPVSLGSNAHAVSEVGHIQAALRGQDRP
jgi:putative hydrolase